MTFQLTRTLTGSTAAAAVALALMAPAAFAQPTPAAQPAPAPQQGTAAQPATRHPADPLLIGHRGAAGTAPENTVAAFKDGRASGADFIETDVQLSADGVPFLFHDNTPARTTDVEDVFPGRENDPVTSFSWAELQLLDAGSYFAERFAGQRIPHLDDVARLATGSTGVYLEIKSPANSPGIERLVAEELRTNPDWTRLVAAGKVQVLGFDADSNRRFAQLAPEVPLQQLSGTVPAPGVLADWAGFADSVGTNYRTLTAAQVADVKAAGLVMGVYTANSPEAVRASIALGVDAVTGDFPIQAARALAGQDPFPAARGLEIAGAVNNPAGDDLQVDAGEHVVLRNSADRPLDASGMVLRDTANNVLTVGQGYVVAPGAELRVHTGPGTNTSDAYYNGRSTAVLNNGGDSVALWTGQGKLQDVLAN